tara:strand:+ start:1715 stop:2407 length:693 start_codon:yes stop_codon:yes gene_type:complete
MIKNKINLIVLLIIFILIFILILFYQSKIISNFENNSGSNPCTDKLTDLEYLEHMIPHHQVAIDMSNLLIKLTSTKEGRSLPQNPEILHICRDITRKQSYEIWEMEMMKKKLIETIFSSKKWSVDKILTKFDKYNPIMSKSKDGDCNPLFFKPKDHSNMMNHMELTDRSYLEHMIPHHQVAIDMSERLLLHTNNSYLLLFCRKLIIEQQSEIYLMNNLLKNTYNYKSYLV